MDKNKAETILEWWRNKFYYEDEFDDREIWNQLEGDDVVTYTMGEIKEFINVAPV